MQTVTQLRVACARLLGSAETFPFGLDTLVLKVGGKMYALIGIHGDPLTLSLKCDPGRAEALRQEHEQITPGYHLSKRHWNTLTLGRGLSGERGLSDALISELLQHSYALVVGSLTRAQRAELG